MCVAIYKPQNVDFPSWRKLEKCFRKNPDGAGFMWIENNIVHIKKGFMNWQDFKKALKPYKDDPKYKKVDFGIHFRISTQGGVNAGCTHPFPLTQNIKTLQTTNLNTNVGIIHNGIIPLTTNYTSKSNLSDTMLFVKDYLSQIAPNQEDYKNPYKMDIVEEVINSKMLIFCGDGTINKLGAGWSEIDNVSYSNLYWQDVPKVSKAKIYPNYTKYNTYYNGWEDDWYNEKSPKQIDYETTPNWNTDDECLYEITGDWNDCAKCKLGVCVYWNYKSYI